MKPNLARPSLPARSVDVPRLDAGQSVDDTSRRQHALPLTDTCSESNSQPALSSNRDQLTAVVQVADSVRGSGFSGPPGTLSGARPDDATARTAACPCVWVAAQTRWCSNANAAAAVRDPDVELGEDVRQMPGDRLLRQHQRRRDLGPTYFRASTATEWASPLLHAAPPCSPSPDRSPHRPGRPRRHQYRQGRRLGRACRTRLERLRRQPHDPLLWPIPATTPTRERAGDLDYRLCCTTRTMRISRTPPSTWAVPSATKPCLR